MDYKVKRKHISYDSFKKEVLKDFEIINLSRECSIEGRKEVLTGKAILEFSEMEKNCLKLQWQSTLKRVISGLGIIVIKLSCLLLMN